MLFNIDFSFLSSFPSSLYSFLRTYLSRYYIFLLSCSFSPSTILSISILGTNCWNSSILSISNFLASASCFAVCLKLLIWLSSASIILWCSSYCSSSTLFLYSLHLFCASFTAFSWASRWDVMNSIICSFSFSDFFYESNWRVTFDKFCSKSCFCCWNRCLCGSGASEVTVSCS